MAAIAGTGTTASTQAEAVVGLSKSPRVASVAPGTPFTYALKYSCSSLVTTCNGVMITDVLPPQLSHLAADVSLVGDAHTTVTAYNPATGTATFTLASPPPAGLVSPVVGVAGMVLVLSGLAILALSRRRAVRRQAAALAPRHRW